MILLSGGLFGEGSTLSMSLNNTFVTSDTSYGTYEQKTVVRELMVTLHLKSCTFASSRIRVKEFLSPSVEHLKTCMAH